MIGMQVSKEGRKSCLGHATRTVATSSPCSLQSSTGQSSVDQSSFGKCTGKSSSPLLTKVHDAGIRTWIDKAFSSVRRPAQLLHKRQLDQIGFQKGAGPEA